MAKNFDSLVIGGGLIGLMTARELGIAGHKVALFESKSVGSESSRAGGGILSPLYPWREPAELSELTLWSQLNYPCLTEILHQTTGIDPEWNRCGMKILAAGAEQEQALEWAEENKVSLEYDADEQSLWLRDVAQIRNPLLISALKKDLESTGIEIRENTVVTRIRVSGHNIEAIETTDGEFAADMAVIASGAWSSDLLPDLAIRPVRGQMICYQAPPGFINHILMKNGIYLIPRRDGSVLVGSTIEEVGYDKGITDEAKTHFMQAAEEMLPGISRFPVIGHWSGLRPAASRNIPYIGPHPAAEDLYVNTGHHRNGILHAPGSARLLADIILKREPVISPEVFQYR